MNRRDLLRGMGLAAAGSALPLARARASAVPPSDRLTVGCIGVGAQGTRVLLDALRLPEIQVVAVCDVNRGSSDYLDWGPNELRDKVRETLGDATWGARNTGPTAGREVAQEIVSAFYAREAGSSKYHGCRAYEDFRDLLAKERDLDAVMVSTPDHWHAPIAIAAMRAGKHVYSQKPMAHNVWQCREMARVAQQTGRATQVSIFNSNSAASRQVHDLLASGIVGPVHGIDIWTKRASKFWQQGLPTPTVAQPVPPGLDWDLWLGPAPARPFNHAYLPFVWRAWYDFGCGALGDMGEYGFDTISRALDLGVADRIDASTTDLYPECYPVASTVHFHFPARTSRPEIDLTWYDGGLEPARPAGLPASLPLGTGGEGVLYHGEHGILMTAFMGEEPRLLRPDGTLERTFPGAAATPEPFQTTRPELGKTASGANAEHYLQWVRACHGGPPAMASYGYEAPIVETLLLGSVAQRTHEPLRWNAAEFQLEGASAKATELLHPGARPPYALT